jgi:UPF0755 protein
VRQRDREASAYADGADSEGGFTDQDEPNEPGDSILGDYDTAEDDEGRLPRVTRVSRREREDRGTDQALTRSARHQRARRRQNRRFVVILAMLVVALVAVAVWLVVLPLYHYVNPDDYSGPGGKAVLVAVRSDDDATAIGATLVRRHVVASTRAFTDAASDNSASKNIQPGSYRLREHMSAKNALTLLLTPSARVNSDVLVPEGATILDVQRALTTKPCTANSPADAVCGPGLNASQVTRAFANTRALGLPTDYTVGGRTPTSPEGFLFPATYTVAGTTNPSAVLQQMVNKFTDQARQTNFTAQARALHITPYQELIIASIAEKEAKFPADYARVAQVILNRLAEHQSLQIDATSAYGAKLKGLDLTKVIYAQLDSPYNSYTHAGLPPTPIANPGLAAMNGAAHPAGGNALYYVNGDAAGHLFFTNSAAAFGKAAAKCRAEHWGCG